MAAEAVMYEYEQELRETAAAIAAPGKGILAADESTGTIGKRLANINLENTLENRQAYRGLLFTTENLGEHLSGVILYEETLYQSTPDGTPFVELIKGAGVIPGIKVDLGTRAMPFFPGHKYSQGLTDLTERVARYYEAGARFAKWRAVLSIIDGDIPDAVIQENAWTLARYAAICQRGGLVPIVEPEIMMDGTHNLVTSQRVTEKVLAACYKAMSDQNVLLEGSLLKPNMCLAGKESGEQNDFARNGLATLTCLRRTVPAAVPGIVFLSGGQTEEEATMNLNAINSIENMSKPWSCTFSYGRALQASVLKTWMGNPENVAAAQEMLRLRARANGMANLGQYDGFAATEEAKASLYEKGYTY